MRSSPSPVDTRRSSTPYKTTPAVLAALVVAFAACEHAGPVVTALEVPTTPRQPDGVLVEPPPAVPSANDLGAARLGVVALRPPVSDEQVAAVIRAYVTALEYEAVDDLAELLTLDAVSLEAGARVNRVGLRQRFAERFGRHELRRLRGLDIARLDKVERYGFADLGAATDPVRPTEMREADLYVRVPLSAPLGANGEKLVGDVLVLLLRRDEDQKKLRIAGVAELDNP